MLEWTSRDSATPHACSPIFTQKNSLDALKIALNHLSSFLTESFWMRHLLSKNLCFGWSWCRNKRNITSRLTCCLCHLHFLLNILFCMCCLLSCSNWFCTSKKRQFRVCFMYFIWLRVDVMRQNGFVVG